MERSPDQSMRLRGIFHAHQPADFLQRKVLLVAQFQNQAFPRFESIQGLGQ